jgi:trehalose-6-phosphate synthase
MASPHSLRHTVLIRFLRIGSAMEVGALREHLDLRVHDRVALDEIELYAEVLSAVAASDRPLTAEELDQVLGVNPSARASVRSN